MSSTTQTKYNDQGFRVEVQGFEAGPERSWTPLTATKPFRTGGASHRDSHPGPALRGRSGGGGWTWRSWPPARTGWEWLVRAAPLTPEWHLHRLRARGAGPRHRADVPSPRPRPAARVLRHVPRRLDPLPGQAGGLRRAGERASRTAASERGGVAESRRMDSVMPSPEEPESPAETGRRSCGHSRILIAGPSSASSTTPSCPTGRSATRMPRLTQQAVSQHLTVLKTCRPARRTARRHPPASISLPLPSARCGPRIARGVCRPDALARLKQAVERDHPRGGST